MSRSKRLWAAFALALCVARPAVAQPEPEPGEEAEVEPTPRLSVIGRFSVARLARWLSSDDLDERLRGIERMGEVGTAAALAKLTSHAFERRAQLVGREWLTLARALAPHAAEPKAQLVLAMLLNQSPGKGAGPEEGALLELARGTAALALAADGSQSSLIVLGRALRTVGAPAAAAADALVAHPPPLLGPLLDVPGPPSVELARLLGALGDQRAFHPLRDWVRGEPPDVRAAAAVALTRLGHLETVPLAALWLERGPRELRAAALEILLLVQDARATPALAALLGEPRPGDVERRLLLDYPSPSLAPALLEGLASGVDGGAAFRWTLLGRVGGEAAARRLAAALAEEGSAFAAAHALSRAPDAFAHDALRAQLDAEAPSPLAVRAAAVRAEAWRERFDGLEERAAAWIDSSDPRERATGAWLRSLSGGADARRELESGDWVRLSAAATSARAFDAETIDAAVRLLAKTPPGAARTALAACLVAPAARRDVSTELLWSLVAEAGAARPLALRALASRSDPEVDVGVTSYLDHPDALLRQHVARGLGESSRASAVGLLVRRLAFETDEGVRRAIVTALAAQHGRVVSQWLARSARLDPSARVRAVASLGVAGVPLADPSGGDEVLWTELRHTEAAEPSARDGSGLGAVLSVAPGLAMPVFADPAGVLVVSGLPSTHLGIRLQ
ncbi:MAG TPA: HEAT repeat domain-containing protein [Polyangiaceae bacterium]|nr:HEAT repeat domain-containing protein [Polyangiaceae bacterium]